MNDAVGVHPEAGVLAGALLLAARGVPQSPEALAGAAIEARVMVLQTVSLLAQQKLAKG